MEVQAVGKYLRISPRKLVPMAALLKKKKASVAVKELRFVNKKSARVISGVLTSAIANAKNNFSLGEDNLVIKKIEIGKGPTLKRWRAASKGRAHSILKRTSHVKVVLENMQGTNEDKSKIGQTKNLEVMRDESQKSDKKGDK